MFPRRRLLALSAVPLLLAACQAGMPGAGAAPQRFVVFFTEDSAALNENGEQVIVSAANAAKAAPMAGIRVLGFAGPAGSAAFNQAISNARARHVADELIRLGIPAARIEIRPRGPVPFEAMPTESRRVEIVIGG